MIGAFHGTCFLCAAVVEKQLIARRLFGVFFSFSALAVV